jgi:hypothetical protein
MELDQVLIAQVALWIVVVAAFLMSGQASLFHPVTMYLLFHALVFVARPILVVCFGFDSVWNYMFFDPSPEVLAKSLAVSSVALLVFCSTCMAFGWCQAGNYASQPRAFTRLEKEGLVLTTVLLLPIIAYSIHVGFSGGATGERVGGTYIMTGTSGYINDAQVMAGSLICAWLMVTRFRWPVILLAAVYVMYRCYGGWARWTFLLFFLATALVYAWQHQRRWMPFWSLLLILPMFFLFDNIGKNRSWFQDMLSGHTPMPTPTESLTESDRLRQKYDTVDFANYDYLTFVVAMVPERTGRYSYGVQHLQLFTEPVPRALWKGKPVGAPVPYFNLNDYGNFLGLTVTMAGDGWMSGGWVGVIITAGIIGLSLGVAHRWFWQGAQRDNIMSLVYILGVAMIPQQYRDGGVVSIAKFLLWSWLPLVVWLGSNWLLGPRLFPSQSILLPRGARLRLVGPSMRTPPVPASMPLIEPKANP